MQTGAPLLDHDVTLILRTEPGVKQLNDVWVANEFLQNVNFGHGHVQVRPLEGFHHQGFVALVKLRLVHNPERPRADNFSRMGVRRRTVTGTGHPQEARTTVRGRLGARLYRHCARGTADARERFLNGIVAGRPAPNARKRPIRDPDGLGHHLLGIEKLVERLSVGQGDETVFLQKFKEMVVVRLSWPWTDKPTRRKSERRSRVKPHSPDANRTIPQQQNKTLVATKATIANDFSDCA